MRGSNVGACHGACDITLTLPRLRCYPATLQLVCFCTSPTSQHSVATCKQLMAITALTWCCCSLIGKPRTARARLVLLHAATQLATVDKQNLDVRSAEKDVSGVPQVKQQVLDDLWTDGPSHIAVGPSSSKAERLSFWIPELLGKPNWRSRATDIAKFYARYGVGMLGLHREVSWDDGFMPVSCPRPVRFG